MPIQTANQPLAQQIKEHLEKHPSIRPFPTAVTRLLAESKNPNSSTAACVPIIESDASLAVQVMRMANSPLFGLPKVQSIAHAVSLLGTNKLRTLAFSVAGANMFDGGSDARKQRQFVWNHSIGCAIVARLLADHNPTVAPEDVYLGGIFHDVGKLLFYDLAPVEYTALAKSFSGSELTHQEDLLFGTNHEDVGLKSAHSWQLPKEIKAAIGWHHKPNESPAFQDVATTVFYADALAKSWGVGPADASSNLRNEAMAEFGLTEEVLDELQTQALDEFATTMQAWAS